MRITISVSRTLNKPTVIELGKRIIQGLFPGKTGKMINAQYEEVSVKGSFETIGRILLISGWTKTKPGNGIPDIEKDFDVEAECWTTAEYPDLYLKVQEDTEQHYKMLVSVTPKQHIAEAD